MKKTILSGIVSLLIVGFLVLFFWATANNQLLANIMAISFIFLLFSIITKEFFGDYLEDAFDEFSNSVSEWKVFNNDDKPIE